VHLPIVHVSQLNCYDAPLTDFFIVSDMWPSNSTDLSLVDYAICSIIQQRVYETRVHDIDELRQHLLHVCCSLVVVADR